MRISDVLTSKPSHEVVTIRPDATVRDLLGLLAQHNVGAVVVSGDGEAVDGIVSERDVVRSLYDDESTLDAAVSAIMTSDVATCEEDTHVDNAGVMMTAQRIPNVPVSADRRFSGI